MSDVHAYLDKAARSLSAAELPPSNDDVDFAASRAYYGCSYVAEAFLSDEGVSVSTHAGVIGEYGRLFAKTGRLDRRFHRLLNRAFRARQSADYDLHFDLGGAEVRELISEGRVFLKTAKDYLERENAQDAAE